MDDIVQFLLVFLNLSLILTNVSATTYNVKLRTESHINMVNNKFLSFTVDPKFLFSAHENRNNGQDLKYCMATSLTPAYLRIAGPSTINITFQNYTITFTDLNLEDNQLAEDFETKVVEDFETKGDEDFEKKRQIRRSKSLFLDSQEIVNKRSIESFGLKRKRFDFEADNFPNKPGVKRNNVFYQPKRYRPKIDEKLMITYFQWKQFTTWAQNIGFELVFALNNGEKMENGLWDPNPSLDILTLADGDNISNVYWELGYECRNQSIDDYLNDLETLGAIIESFSAKNWKTVGGDVSKCLSTSSKSDFRDYVVLTDQMADAVVLDANSSAHELNRMPEQDRNNLLQQLAHSYTPLWLVDSPPIAPYFEFHRAVDWITSLGYSAKNGFSVHFRELVEEEMYAPSLSFYMALLFKHLVGNKVLDVDMESSESVLFAHCTSLHHQPVPGAVTVYGANLADETARFLMKLSKREDRGDIMHFILGHDLNGDVILNGKPITEDNIRPVVKHARPYKTMLLNLPPKSIGFWVIANIQFDTCQAQDHDTGLVEAQSVEGDSKQSIAFKSKRSAQGDADYVSLDTLVKEGLNERFNTINRNFHNIRKVFDSKEEVVFRKKRQVDDNELSFGKSKLRKFVAKYRNADKPKPLYFVKKLFGLIPRPEAARDVVQNKERKTTKSTKNKNIKKSPKALKLDDEITVDDNIVTADIGEKLNRKRRSLIITEKSNSEHKKSEELSSENEIDIETEKQMKLWTILHKIHEQIKDLSLEDEDLNVKKRNEDSTQIKDENIDSIDEDQFIVKTKMAKDGATINVKEKSKRGILKSTVNNVVSVLSDLNHNLNSFWNAIHLLD